MVSIGLAPPRPFFTLNRYRYGSILKMADRSQLLVGFNILCCDPYRPFSVPLLPEDKKAKFQLLVLSGMDLVTLLFFLLTFNLRISKLAASSGATPRTMPRLWAFLMLVISAGAFFVIIKWGRKKTILYPLIFAFSILGSYSIKKSMFDVGTCLEFGLIGWMFKKFNYPSSPLVLELVLGKLIETNYV